MITGCVKVLLLDYYNFDLYFAAHPLDQEYNEMHQLSEDDTFDKEMMINRRRRQIPGQSKCEPVKRVNSLYL